MTSSAAPAVVAIVVGAATGAVSLIKASQVKSQCKPDGCPPSTMGEVNMSLAIAHVSTATFIVGGVATTAGAALLVIRSRGTAKATAHARTMAWTARIGLDRVELGGNF
jgi:hypothetical protein